MSSRAWLLIAIVLGGWGTISSALAEDTLRAEDALTTQSIPSTPAALISKFRIENKEGPVTSDAKLNKIAQDQASAMAAKEKLDHDVLGPFGSRVASSGSDRAAENIAYGHDSFPKTLDQWINSPSHRKNLLMKEGSRIGVASATSPSGRTYWAMVIAEYKADEPKVVPPRTFVKKQAKVRPVRYARAYARSYSRSYSRRPPPIRRYEPECRARLIGICL